MTTNHAINNGAVQLAPVYEITKQLQEKGISTIPLALDGSKAPHARLLPLVESWGKLKRSWKPYQDRVPEDVELDTWFRKHNAGYGIVQGRGREVL